jgi:GNAT superfamily N-acetyltransferase
MTATDSARSDAAHSVHVRAMRRDDLPTVAALCRELGYAAVDEVTAAERFARVAALPDAELLVAADGDDRPLGFLQVMEKHSLNQPAQAVVHSVVVAERMRGRGVGSRLMNAAEAWARTRGLERLALTSRDHRVGAHAFYTRRGYALEKRALGFVKTL